MKKLIALLLALICLLSALPAALAAQESPQPIPVVAPEDRTPTPPGIHHYLLICLDKWDYTLRNQWVKDIWDETYDTNTDGLILVTVNENDGSVKLTSFIRDMLIQRPDGEYGRINNFLYANPTTQTGGWAWVNKKSDTEAFQDLVDTINSHFDLNIEKFIVMDFRQVQNIIDAVGGVDVEITNREARKLFLYPIGASATSPSLQEGSRGGVYHMTGYAAVIYMRIRKIETKAYLHADGTTHSDNQDYGRTYRDRMVLTALADSLKDVTLDRATALLDVILSNTVYTNMTTRDFEEALTLAMALRGAPVQHIRMPADGTKYWESGYAGMATKEIDYLGNRAVLHDFLFGFTVVDE
ncbi:MAG: LCP family protein [Clostridiales bacterium]|nr:LCP family protein [Clostridiales bacterium]